MFLLTLFNFLSLSSLPFPYHSPALISFSLSPSSFSGSPSLVSHHLSDAPEPLDAATPSLEERGSLPRVRGIEEGRDLLTCGQCSQAFPLAHILAFIQHKQGGCHSRNHDPNTHTPPSPAHRTQQRGVVTQVEAGFVELRRVTDRSRGEEHSVKVAPNRTGECRQVPN